VANILNTYIFTIEGRPRPKERPRHALGNLEIIAAEIFNLFKRTPSLSFNDFLGRFKRVLTENQKVYTPNDTHAYENLVGYSALNALKTKIEENMMRVEINLYFSDRKVGDVDNYTKSILDGLHSIMDDDKQVKKVIVEKFIGVDENGDKITKDKERADLKIEILDELIYYKKKEVDVLAKLNKSKNNDKVVKPKPNKNFFQRRRHL
jgi:Holliday junction resolvase RusA-like endonuclease